jgi:hypothetical protein
MDQRQLFYLFNLEDRIPDHHLLRRINPTVTQILGDLRDKLEPFYSEIGRPSVDPELMIRMLMVAYCYGNATGPLGDIRPLRAFLSPLPTWAVAPKRTSSSQRWRGVSAGQSRIEPQKRRMMTGVRKRADAWWVLNRRSTDEGISARH